MTDMRPILTSDASLPPPFVYVSGIANFRDLGGHQINSSPSHSFRQKFIYRCGDPTRVSPEGVKTLQGLGITNVFDLRSYTEVVKGQKAGSEGVAQWEGCERTFVPVFEHRAYDPESVALRYGNYAEGGPEVNDTKTQHKNEGEEQFLKNFATQGFAKAYADILEKGAQSSYPKILQHIANEPDKPLIIHCTAGKDRTGVLCALLLSLCGVDDETVAKEYELTETGLTSMVPQIMEHLKEHPAMKGNEAGILNMLSAKKANMLGTLELIREKYGGPEGYMIDACGLSKDDVENIRKNLVRETPAVHEL